jgi:hypothetical protein
MKLNIQGWNCKNPIHKENDVKIATKRNMTKFDTKIKWKKKKPRVKLLKKQINQENN